MNRKAANVIKIDYTAVGRLEETRNQLDRQRQMRFALAETLELLLKLEPALEKYRKYSTVFDSSDWDLDGMREAVKFAESRAAYEKYADPVVES